MKPGVRVGGATRTTRATGRTSLLCLLATLSCTPGDSTSEWAGTVDTLQTGVIRTTNPAEGLWAAAPWSLAPEQVIGRVDGEGPDLFSAISGLEVGADGRIYVLDRQTNELRIFGPDGTHERTVGRTGEGPGEYRAVNGIAWLTPDSLVLIDQRGGRYSVLTADGDWVRSVPRRLGFYRWVFSGSVHDGTIFEEGSARAQAGEEYEPVFFRTPLREDGTPDTVAVPQSDVDPETTYFAVRSERGGMNIGVPFAPGAHHLVATDGVWYGHGGEPRLVKWTLAGDTVREVVLGTEPAPVSAEEIDEWSSQPFVDQFRDLGGDIDFDLIPDAKPHFDDLFLDDAGNLWLAVPTPPGRTAFHVVDPDGRFLGRLEVAGVDRMSSLHPVVRNDRLHFVGLDELDVQKVYVYRINRPGAR